MSATKRFDFGGTVWGPNSQKKFAAKDRILTQNGGGVSRDVRAKRAQKLAFKMEVFVKINGERFYLWRAIEHEGTVLECVVTKRRGRRSAVKLLRKLLSSYGSPNEIVMGKLRSYHAALR